MFLSLPPPALLLLLHDKNQNTLTTQSENHSNNDTHFSRKIPKELFLTRSQVFRAALTKNETESDVSMGETWSFLAHINKKAPCNLWSVLLLCSTCGHHRLARYLIPRRPPVELGRGLGHFRCCSNTTDKTGDPKSKEHWCNLISRSISSTKGGKLRCQCKSWNSAGTFFICNF